MKQLRFRSKRVEQIPPYMFAELNKKKNRLRANGVDLIDLGIGDPDLPTPEHVLDKMQEELRRPENSKYPSYIGCLEFREAVARYYMEMYGVELDPETEVIALIGSKEGLANLIYSQVDPGDVALIPDPCYPVYRMATLLANGEYCSVPLKRENGFLPDYAQIGDSALDRARLLFVNYPNNPTAAVADRAFYERTIEFARQHKLVVAHDFAYNEVGFDGYKPMSILQVAGAKDVAVELGSLSKTFSMTGWRIGYMVGNIEVIKAMTAVKSNVDSGQFTAIQRTAAYALNGPRDFLVKNLNIYKQRQQAVLSGLQTLGIEAEASAATFFVWAPVPAGEGSSAQFAETILEQTGVVVTPGVAFGAHGEGYFRISLSVPTDRLREAIERIQTQLTLT